MIIFYGEEEPVFKVVYNAAVSGGLHLSEKAMDWLKERGIQFHEDLPRHLPLLVDCIETLGEEANGSESGWRSKAELQVATITGRYYYIDDHDGAGEEVIDVSNMIDVSE